MDTTQPGTQYVIEQLGQALATSHAIIAQQAERIRDLESTAAQERGPAQASTTPS